MTVAAVGQQAHWFLRWFDKGVCKHGIVAPEACYECDYEDDPEEPL